MMLQNSIAFNSILDLFRPGQIRLSCIQYIVVLVYIQDWKLQSNPPKNESTWIHVPVTKYLFKMIGKRPAKYRCMPAHVYLCVCTTIHNIYIYIYLFSIFILSSYITFIDYIDGYLVVSQKKHPKTQERSTRITRLILDKVPLADAGLEGS